MKELEGNTLKNRYFIRKWIGGGGMANVYLVWDNLGAVKKALKILHSDLARDPQERKRFVKEAGLLKKLAHPNIVRIYEFDRDGDLFFISRDQCRMISQTHD